ncbi:MAG: EamA family transporter [Desulfovibrionaceae bacterium]|nr:EamA family transporter [Desulfovibrionaceae bacterium]
MLLRGAAFRSLSGYGYALLAAGLWGLLGPVSRLCLSGGTDPLEVAFWRACIGGLCFVAHALFRRELFVRPAHGLAFCLFGVCGVSLFFGAYQVAVRESGAALAVVLLYTAPVWVALFSRALFGERLTRRKLAALAVALGGTVLVCLSGGSAGSAPSWLGIGCGLAAGFFYATHYPFYTWWQKRYSTATLYTFMLLAGALALAPFVTFTPHNALTWAGLGFLGVFCTYGAYLAYGAGLRRLSPVRAAVVSNLEPVIGTLLAWAWWHEKFSPCGWLGGVLVLAAVFILTTDRR